MDSEQEIDVDPEDDPDPPDPPVPPDDSLPTPAEEQELLQGVRTGYRIKHTSKIRLTKIHKLKWKTKS